MRIVGFYVPMLTYWGIFLVGAVAGAGVDEPSRLISGQGNPVGVVMGISGGSVSIASGELAPRAVKVGDLLATGDEISTGAGATIDVLWDHRALLSLHEESRLHIQELHHGQTEVRLHWGTARIALSYDAGRMTDKLTLQTAHARVVSRGGILEATVTGGEQRSLFARLVNAPPMDTLRMWEGQARIEPLNGEVKPFSLKAGSEVSLKSGTVSSIADIQSDPRVMQPLALREEHQGLPQPVMREIARAHVDLALEVEKELQRASAAGNEKELPGTTTKGAILATTTGLPSLPGAQALGGGNTTGAPSFPTSGSIVSQPLASLPSTQAFGGGNTAGTPSFPTSSSAVSLPVVSPIQSAGTGAGSAQSGGLNSSGLLKQILNEVGKGAKGKDKK
jgi:hypothetical protein